jgi:hypothetical protein
VGKLNYNHRTVEFEDRVLAHLQIVIGAKLRRNEPFYFSWRDDAHSGDGRTVIWMHPTIPLSLKFFGSRTPAINPAWVERLMETANSIGGLRLVPEPDAPTAGN